MAGKLVSGKYWQLVLWGEVPAGIKPEQWAALVSQGVSISAQLLPAVANLSFATGDTPPVQPGDGKHVTLA